MGVVKRSDDSGRVHQIKFDPSGLLFAVHSDSKIVEVFRERSLEAQKKKYMQQVKLNEKKKEDKERYAKNHIPDADEEEQEQESGNNEKDTLEINFAGIEYSNLCNIEASQKVRSIDFHPVKIDVQANKQAKFKLLLSTLRNSVEEYTVPFAKKEGQATRSLQIARQGHGMPIRAVAFSSDSYAMCSVSNRECKVWSVETGTCVRSFTDLGYALCCKFLPGNKHIVVGTKQGDLHLLDVNSGEQVQLVQKAHDGAIWSVIVKPDKRGIITGSSDKV